MIAALPPIRWFRNSQGDFRGGRENLRDPEMDSCATSLNYSMLRSHGVSSVTLATHLGSMSLKLSEMYISNSDSQIGLINSYPIKIINQVSTGVNYVTVYFTVT